MKDEEARDTDGYAQRSLVCRTIRGENSKD